MTSGPVTNFLRQQGFAAEAPDRATGRFRGLQFQPTIVGSVLLVAILTQSPALFLVLSAVLWLNALVPAANPFETFYNRFIARPRGRPPLSRAPGPRRFAQGMAATLLLAAGLSLVWAWTAAAYVFEGLLVVAFGALLFGKFCLGAYVYHLLRGNVAFANGTCPWSD